MSIYLPSFPPTQRKEKSSEVIEDRPSISQSLHQEIQLTTPWSDTFSLQNYEEIISYCLSHPIYGILLLQQPKQTDTKRNHLVKEKMCIILREYQRISMTKVHISQPLTHTHIHTPQTHQPEHVQGFPSQPDSSLAVRGQPYQEEPVVGEFPCLHHFL